MMCYAMLCYVMLCYDMLCYAILCYVTPRLPKDASILFRGPLNILVVVYAPRNGLKDAVYKDVIELLYNEDMSDLDVYVSIQDLWVGFWRCVSTGETSCASPFHGS